MNNNRDAGSAHGRHDSGVDDIGELAAKITDTLSSELRGVGQAANRLKDITKGFFDDIQYRVG
jgi:hypothetical protein